MNRHEAFKQAMEYAEEIFYYTGNISIETSTESETNTPMRHRSGSFEVQDYDGHTSFEFEADGKREDGE